MMRNQSRLWIIPAVILVTAVSLRAASTEAPTENFNAGDHDCTLKCDNRDRTYRIHIPPNYDGTKALPLVMFFHGGMGTAKHASEAYGWNEKADKDNFLVVYPNGTGSIQTWNCMNGCGSAFKNQIDDVGFVKALVKDLSEKLKIDSKRIYATGMSNGAMLTHRLAAEMSDVFAAAAPVAGTIGGKENANAQEKRIPQPANPVPMIIFHGKKDNNVSYDGGESRGAERGRIDISVAESVAFWVRVNGCKSSASKEEIASGTVVKESYASDNGNDVALYTIVDGGHAWPGAKRLKVLGNSNAKISATDTIWDFFAAHSKK